MCKVIIAMGDSSFKYSMSTFMLRNGFKITIQNDESLTNYDVQEIAKCVLATNTISDQISKTLCVTLKK